MLARPRVCGRLHDLLAQTRLPLATGWMGLAVVSLVLLANAVSMAQNYCPYPHEPFIVPPGKVITPHERIQPAPTDDARSPSDQSRSTEDTQRPSDQARSTDDAQTPSDQGLGGQTADPGFGSVAGATGPAAGVPGTIGDLGGGTLSLGSNFLFAAGSNLGLAGGDRRYKAMENNSPIPRNRVFVDYNHFHNSLVGPDGKEVNLDRFVFGIEKTILCPCNSIELRVPFSDGLNSSQTAGTTREGTEFGDISLTFKRVLYEDCCHTLSGGLAMTIPTGSDATFTNAANSLQVDNEAFHLMPFLGYLGAPNDCWFYQGWLQLDFDTNGYSYTSTITPMTGDVQDPTLMFVSGSIGRWIHRGCCCDCLRGIAAMVELHYTTTLEDPDVDANLQFREGRFDILNLTCGFHFDLRNYSTLRCFAVAPLKGDLYNIGTPNTFSNDRFFDAEVGVQLNHQY